MATEASRSSAPTASTTTSSGVSVDSYIGSFISLTSKSEIRYEGILFTINTQEASIGLRNVRSFGTEGRRTDGQVPASDKVYEYIVFRGSDIKDLQVKSSPPVQTAPQVHYDPAIIQSQYTAPNLPTASLSSAGPISDFSTHISPPVTTYQNNVPLYPPVGNNTPQWTPSPPSTNTNSPSIPMYWQGYYGSSVPLQAQTQAQAQQPLLRPVQSLSVPPPMNPPSSGPSNITSVSQSIGFPPPLLQPITSTTPPMQPNVLPVQSSSNTASNMLPNVLVKTSVGPLIPNQVKPISSTSMPLSGLSESLSIAVGQSNSPTLVTPGQFLQPGSTISSPTGQTEQKDVEVVQAPPLLPPPLTSTILPEVKEGVTVSAPTDVQAPLLPLPSPSDARVNGYTSQTRHVHRGGHGRRRGNEFSRPMANFTEDFDFEAMNEKFKKDEVWGHLGKSKEKANDGVDLQDGEDVDVPKVDVKPVYNKDDFFDTLSSNAMDRENRNGRPRFSEQMRLDTETFGNFPRNRGYRGGRGPGGRSRGGGGYYGRGNGHGYGYGHVGRGGRGNSVYRAI